jgi:hypothetical protein
MCRKLRLPLLNRTFEPPISPCRRYVPDWPADRSRTLAHFVVAFALTRRDPKPIAPAASAGHYSGAAASMLAMIATNATASQSTSTGMEKKSSIGGAGLEISPSHRVGAAPDPRVSTSRGPTA